MKIIRAADVPAFMESYEASVHMQSRPSPAAGPVASATRDAGTRVIVVQLVKRDGHYCHYCGIPLQVYGPLGPFNMGQLGGRRVALGRADYEIDHTTPRHHGGKNDLSNLVLACSFCNGHKGAKPYDRFIREMDEWMTRYHWRIILAELRAQCDYTEVPR